jgi:hypothetical protein
MLSIEIQPSEFLCLYDLLSLQQLQSGDQILIGLRGRMREVLFSLLKQKSNLQFEKWEKQQMEKMLNQDNQD